MPKVSAESRVYPAKMGQSVDVEKQEFKVSGVPLVNPERSGKKAVKARVV